VSQLSTVPQHRVDNTWRSQRWQHAMERYTGQESQFLPTLAAFGALVRGSLSENCHNVWYEKNENSVATRRLKNRRYVYSFRQNVRTWRTDRRTDTGRRHRPRLCIASRDKNGNSCRLQLSGQMGYDIGIVLLNLRGGSTLQGARVSSAVHDTSCYVDCDPMDFTTKNYRALPRASARDC